MNYGSSATYSGAPSAWARMVSGVRHRAAGAHRQSSWVTPGPRLALSGQASPPPPARCPVQNVPQWPCCRASWLPLNYPFLFPARARLIARARRSPV